MAYISSAVVLFAVAVAAGGPEAATRSAAPSVTTMRLQRDGRAMLVAGGLLTGAGVLGRVGLEVFWRTTAGLEPGAPFGKWSLANIAFVTNWNSAMFLGPGLGLLAGGMYRRARHDALPGRGQAARRMRRVGVGLLGGGLGLWVLTRAVMLPIADACGSNACFYGTLESTFWIGTAATFTGALHLAYAQGHLRGASRVQLAPSLGMGFTGLTVSGRF